VKTLVIFDFDDTLFLSDAMVGIKRPGEPKKYLSSHEYAIYVPHKKDEFDYEQFQIYPPNPRPIEKSTKRLVRSVQKEGINNVIVLTARSNAEVVAQVLKDFRMPPVEIYAVGSSDPVDKAHVVEKLVRQRKYDSVVLYEDSSANIDVIRARVKPLLLGNFVAYKVKATPRKEALP